jgi:hypothetical protein
MEDEQLARVWRPTWEKKTGQSLASAIRDVQEEHLRDIAIAADLLRGGDEQFSTYAGILAATGGFDKDTAGSGTNSALYAAALSFLFERRGVAEGMMAAANALGSDTDTIATMAGAIMGAFDHTKPSVLPLDADYLVQEARRLSSVSQNRKPPSFAYPDLLYWRAPKTQLDVVGVVDGKPAVAGLGSATQITDGVAKTTKQPNVGWTWLKLSFGQTILVKRRAKLPRLSSYSMPQPPAELPPMPESKKVGPSGPHPVDREPIVSLIGARQVSLFETESAIDAPQMSDGRKSLDRLTSEVIDSRFNPAVLGKLLLDIIDRSPEDSIDAAIGFAAVIAKARAERNRRQR